MALNIGNYQFDTDYLWNPVETTKSGVQHIGDVANGIKADPSVLVDPRKTFAMQKASFTKRSGISKKPDAPGAGGSGGLPFVTDEPAAPVAPAPAAFDWRGFSDQMRNDRMGDMKDGLDFGRKYFGAGNPAMAEVMDTRRQRALGLNDAETRLMRENASQGINQQMAGGLRQMRSLQAGSGVRGGAASAQAIPVLARANQSRGEAERAIALADMQRRGQELNSYESTLTGERAGLLGTGLGFASMGSADRSGAMQYGLGQDFLDFYKNAAGQAPSEGDKPWDVKTSFKNWRESGYDPRSTPWNQWMHENVFDPNKYGFDSSKYSPNQFIKNI